MVGCLSAASGMAVQWRAHQSVDASVAGQPKLGSPFVPSLHSKGPRMLGCVMWFVCYLTPVDVMVCKGRAPGVRG